MNIIKHESNKGQDIKLTPNKLGNEKSPYLLQHQYNPVNWYPWGEEAFIKAREEDKPIFLSIGYSTCHWWQSSYCTQISFGCSNLIVLK